MAVFTLSDYRNVLRDKYSKLESMVYKDRPLLGMVPKDPTWVGDYLKIPVQYSNIPTVSADFASASLGGVAGTKQFIVGTKHGYCSALLDHETLLASEGGDKAAAKNFFEFVLDGELDALADRAATALYRSGGGVVGQLASTVTVSTAVGTLASKHDHVNFEPGQTFHLATTAAGTTLRGGGTTKLTVLSVDRSNGVVTFTGAINTISGAAAGDYLVPTGDAAAALAGLAGWNPATAPTSGDSWFSVDRSTDTDRLAGLRFDHSNKPLKEAIIITANESAARGNSPDTVFMSFNQYTNLQLELESQTYIQAGAYKNPQISYSGITVAGPRGLLKIIPDQFCPDNVVHIVELGRLKLSSRKSFPHIFDKDGDMLRDAAGTTDSYRVTAGWFGNLICTRPGSLARFTPNYTSV